MWKILVSVGLLFTLSATGAHAMSTREIRTYMPFGKTIDPANVQTLVDLDLSYALASTLVEWGPTHEPVSGLAKTWLFEGNCKVLFTLRKDAKWSDGSAITGQQVVKSFLRAKRLYPELESLFGVVDTIEAPKGNEILFTLKASVGKSGLIQKLTEPMYGVVYVNESGQIDLAKSSGPFILTAQTAHQLNLQVNKNWFEYNSDMASQIVIRKRIRRGNSSQTAFDVWNNLATTSSIMEKQVTEGSDPSEFSTWHRNLDKTYLLGLGPRMFNSTGRQFLRFLNARLNRETLVNGLSGYSPTNQFFPPGYVLYDPSFRDDAEATRIPETFQQRPVEILTIAGYGEKLLNNLRQAIRDATGMEPLVKKVSLNSWSKDRKSANYDLYAISLSVSDPNVEGAMAYFFGLTPTLIPNAGTGSKDFKARVEKAKLLAPEIRNEDYRKVFADAIHDGCILPLFHFSTIALARGGMDLSGIPETDETVNFAKVRFK